MPQKEMSEVASNGNGQSSTAAASERAINVLKQRVGGMSPELAERYKAQIKARKAINDALKAGPRTIPELAAACGLKSEDTVWLVMALRRYGLVVEEELRGDYYAYRLKEVRG